jgi:hypothetical protein
MKNHLSAQRIYDDLIPSAGAAEEVSQTHDGRNAETSRNYGSVGCPSAGICSDRSGIVKVQLSDGGREKVLRHNHRVF